MIRTFKVNQHNGFHQTDIRLDFSGRVDETITLHNYQPNQEPIHIRERYSYSPQDRLEVLTHSINDGPMEMIQNNQYDALGQLVSKRVGGDINLDDSGYQKIDYRYNIRGWLTDINNFLDLQESSALYPDLFAFHINYDQVYDPENLYPGAVEGLYNGNISETYWLSSTDNTIRKYGYRYDKLNRLKDAYFQQPASMDHNCQSYNEHLSYDKNGNILTLNRHSRLENFPAAVEIDDLEYFYQGNQLTKVTDLSGYPQGFKDDSDGTNDDDDDYRYDAFGNMYKDENKQIVFITYNHLNLPVEILFENGSTIHYLYNAAGQKLRKLVSDMSTGGVSTTEYLDGFQYNNSILQFFSHPEGYVLNTPDKYGEPSFDYVYQYKDHLGNIRMNFVFDSDAADLKVLEENHYYPFGLKHENYNVEKKNMKWETELIGGEELERKRLRQVPNSGYQYKYNGKEWQDELGLNFYDYGARNYDPAIGRWMNIDVLSEKYYPISPYTYVANNPIIFIDPDGKRIIVSGQDADRATKALNKLSSLKIKRDSKTGMLTSKGKAKTDYDKVLLEAINSENITVNLKANPTKKIAIDGKVGDITLGAYGGSQIVDGKIEALQMVNMDQIDKVEKAGIMTAGQIVGHEIIEAFIAANENDGVNKANSENGDKAYEKGHNTAISLDENFVPILSVTKHDNGKQSIVFENGKSVILD